MAKVRIRWECHRRDRGVEDWREIGVGREGHVSLDDVSPDDWGVDHDRNDICPECVKAGRGQRY